MFARPKLEVAITSPSFVTLYFLASEIAQYIARGCLLLFYKNYIVYYNVLLSFLKTMCIPIFVLFGCCLSELHDHLGPYRNVLPEAVYCCITRTTLFTELFTCFELEVLSRHHVSLPYTVWFQRKLIVWAEAVYCCVTRTTCTLFTVIIMAFLLKTMCIRSFDLIGCCLSELHGHLGPYRNALLEAVYCCIQELHCLPNCLHVFMT